jgi:LmbE family N-acetylglucosaminyl deacetylase
MKFLAQTRPDIVAVAAKADHHNNHIAIHDALIHAIVRACHHRGILSNLCPNLYNRFSRSLLLV